MPEAKMLTATCLCGASKYSAEAPIDTLPKAAWLCHCTSCRHNNGTLCFMATKWPEKEIKQTGTLTCYPFAPGAVVLFCTTCGTHMFWCSVDEVKSVNVSTRCLGASEELVQFKDHIHLADTKDSGLSVWLHKIGDQTLKRWQHGPGREELPVGWNVNTTLRLTKSDDDLLHAYCLCRGVEFTILRPNRVSESDEQAWSISSDGRYRAGVESCNSCALAAGVDLVQWAFVPTSSVKLDSGEDYRVPFGTLKSYKSSQKATRYFCGRCGACVFFTTTSRPHNVDIAVGLLDAPSGARAEEWLDWTMVEDVNHTVDAPNRALVDAVTAEWREWKRQQVEEAI